MPVEQRIAQLRLNLERSRRVFDPGLPDFLRGLFPVIATVSAEGYQELDDDDVRTRSQSLVDELADRGLPT